MSKPTAAPFKRSYEKNAGLVNKRDFMKKGRWIGFGLRAACASAVLCMTAIDPADRGGKRSFPREQIDAHWKGGYIPYCHWKLNLLSLAFAFVRQSRRGILASGATSEL